MTKVAGVTQAKAWFRKKFGFVLPRLEGFLQGSSEEVLLRRVLRRHLVRASIETEVLRRVLRKGVCHRRRLEGA